MGTFTGFCSRNMGFAPGRCVEETEHAHPVTLKRPGRVCTLILNGELYNAKELGRELKAYQQKLASAVGSLRNDSQLNTPKAILIDLIRALPVCLIILAVGLILLTMQLNISELLWSFSKKLAIWAEPRSEEHTSELQSH